MAFYDHEPFLIICDKRFDVLHELVYDNLSQPRGFRSRLT